jgi:hypothetical protein
MSTIPQYVKIMRDAMWDIAQRFGVDLTQEPKATRAVMLSNLAVQAVLIKALVDKGVITDTELLAAINAMRSSPWSPGPLPVRPVDWDTVPVTGIGVIPVTGA